MSNEMKITKDNFVWKILTLEEAKELFVIGLFEIYCIYPDDSEALLQEFDELEYTVNSNYLLGIEVGKFEININVKE